MNKKIIIKNLDQIEQVVDLIMPIIKNKILLLDGEVGSGKTTLVQHIAKKLNIKETITSPSFNIMKIYPNLVHLDLYNYQGDLDEFEDFFEDNIVVIEWSKKLAKKPKNFVHIEIKYDKKNNQRIYEIKEC
ncbi:tRNA (adenosine(37)-N6)-threonylcarbamoyltransferase complex ATPase subunit type 1 TsaE [Mycoplasmopsis pulmonis]|uniref:tRNA (adenosine(37)-N6)-threonylcarbamoyltransferase complex ATPase subunit type 1 TsaE n=1 Tax=Mycoplasmopsis pulmonis TaxID=2107 RepID=UPI002ACEBADC|nr:tRNA (adenosine(37)-N6)-threonylcarbamoyltransferase complex ATPase subunit type 1 TsaE [Mycoplasmopsis pulmonis]MDZ7293090.1 tRNA (adenosine(37)-N6)-threonylcarbamoyltransferase complex ATPase subunit type 1 TsaE [Mycoplasmopsis pulmonis]